MATTTFPSSAHISPSIRIVERDLSFYEVYEGYSKTALVGFCSKGPINVPTLITTTTELFTTFGHAHPTAAPVASPSFLIYAAIEFLRKGTILYVVRVADTEETSLEKATTAEIDVPSAGSAAIAISENSGAIAVPAGSEFRFRVNGLTTDYVVAVTENAATTVAAVAAEIQTALETAGYDEVGIAVAAIESGADMGKLKVYTNTVNGPSAQVEFVSVLGDICAVVGLGTMRTTAVVTGTNDRWPTGNSDQEFDLAGYGVDGYVNLQVLVYGTNDATIDGVTQTVQIAATDGRTAASIAAEIDGQANGFSATALGGYVVLETLMAGRDAILQVKPASTADTILGLSNVAAIGTSPIKYTSDVDVYEGGYVKGIATGGATGGSFTIMADSAGIEGNLTKVTVSVDPENGNIGLQVFNNEANVETYADLNKDETDTTNYIETINTSSHYISIEDNTSTEDRPAAGTYTLSGGTDGIPADPDDQSDVIIGTQALTAAGAATGLYVLGEPEILDIDLVAVPGYSSTDVILALIDLCENQRQDCMCIIDPPYGMSVDEVTRWHNGISSINTTKFSSDFAALYWPWMKIRDSYNKVDVWVPPSGPVLGVYSYSEAVSFIWTAPAGTERGRIESALEVEYMPYRDERDSLYGGGNAVNTIVNFTAEGILVWGQKTLQRRTTALDRVNVRRLLLYCEKEISKQSKPLIFEPNNEDLWERFTSMARSVLETAKTNGGLYNYAVKCDVELNTPEVIDRNELRAQIGIQPTKAAEFIFIEFSLSNTASLEE